MQTQLWPLPADLPTHEQALASLDEVPKILYHALEHAAQKTQGFRDAECPNERLDGGLSASLLRHHGIRYLTTHGLEAREDDCVWTFNRVPFLGISFYYKRKHIRVLKGPDGELPGCGNSTRKKRFFNQVRSMYLEQGTPAQSTENLIVLWDFDESGALKQLWLALPAQGATRSLDVRAYWCEPIPHPAEAAAPVPTTVAAGDDLDALIQHKVELDDEESNVR